MFLFHDNYSFVITGIPCSLGEYLFSPLPKKENYTHTRKEKNSFCEKFKLAWYGSFERKLMIVSFLVVASTTSKCTHNEKKKTNLCGLCNTFLTFYSSF